MWTTIASTCITSSMFLTAFAPNLLAVELVRKTVQVDLNWMHWFLTFLPVGVLLLLATPLLVYIVYPPKVRTCPEVPDWASQELRALGPLSGHEVVLLGLIALALGLWIFGGSLMDPTTAALLVIGLLVVTRTIDWADVLANKPAFNTLIWFGTLVPLAAGLAQTGVVAWMAKLAGPMLTSLSPMTGLVGLVVLFFLLHYLFASVTAHVTALLPLMLGIATNIHGLPIDKAALALALSLGIMGSSRLTAPAPAQSMLAAAICQGPITGGSARCSAPSI